MSTDPIIIDGYRIIRLLGRGGMASVFLAVQESFDRQVALKVMSPSLNADASFAGRFRREAGIVAQIHHASIVPVYDVGKCGGHHYLSMEYLPGGELKKLIQQPTDRTAIAVNVCLAICSALDVAHRKGFVHRDIKPENILFREDGTPVLTDFGIARAVQHQTQTVAGVIIGTPSYMSPEQIKALELDGRSDLYSLGIVFYEMLTGVVPFRTDSALSTAIKVINEPVPALPAQYCVYQAFLDRLIAKNREDRFASAAQVIQALHQINPGFGPQGTLRLARPINETPAEAVVLAPPPLARTGTFAKLNRRWSIGLGAVAVTTLVVGAELMIGTMRQSAAYPPAEAAHVATSPATSQAVPVEIATENPSAPPSDTQAATAAESAAQATALDSQPTPAKSSAPPRPDSASDAAARRKQIENLLASADEEYVRGSLTEPAGANARDHYRAVLKLDPDNQNAITGLQWVSQVLAARDQKLHEASRTTASEAPAAIAIDEPVYVPYGLHQPRRYRQREHNGSRAESRNGYDGRIDIPMPNIPAPGFGTERERQNH